MICLAAFEREARTTEHLATPPKKTQGLNAGSNNLIFTTLLSMQTFGLVGFLKVREIPLLVLALILLQFGLGEMSWEVSADPTALIAP